MVKDISLPSAIAFNMRTACTFQVSINIPKPKRIHIITQFYYGLQNPKQVFLAYLIVFEEYSEYILTHFP